MQTNNGKNNLKMINLAGAGAIFAVIACTAVFGVGPLVRTGRNNLDKSAKLQDQLQQLDGLSKTLDQVEAERKQTELRLADAENRLPNSQAMDEFMHQLAKVAEDAGLQVDSTVPDKNLQDSGGYKCVPVTITGTGTYTTCYKFLTGLRAMQRLTRLDSLMLEADKKSEAAAADGTGGAPLCRITVDISIFMAR